METAIQLLVLYPNARLFNTYSWGVYLIYRLSPTMGVYIDARESMYGDAFIREYLDIEQGRGGWRNVFDDEGISAALIESQTPLARELETDPAWVQAYSDDRFVIFVRAP